MSDQIRIRDLFKNFSKTAQKAKDVIEDRDQFIIPDSSPMACPPDQSEEIENLNKIISTLEDDKKMNHITIDSLRQQNNQKETTIRKMNDRLIEKENYLLSNSERINKLLKEAENYKNTIHALEFKLENIPTVKEKLPPPLKSEKKPLPLPPPKETKTPPPKKIKPTVPDVVVTQPDPPSNTIDSLTKEELQQRSQEIKNELRRYTGLFLNTNSPGQQVKYQKMLRQLRKEQRQVQGRLKQMKDD